MPFPLSTWYTAKSYSCLQGPFFEIGVFNVPKTSKTCDVCSKRVFFYVFFVCAKICKGKSGPSCLCCSFCVPICFVWIFDHVNFLELDSDRNPRVSKSASRFLSRFSDLGSESFDRWRSWALHIYLVYHTWVLDTSALKKKIPSCPKCADRNMIDICRIVGYGPTIKPNNCFFGQHHQMNSTLPRNGTSRPTGGSTSTFPVGQPKYHMELEKAWMKKLQPRAWPAALSWHRSLRKTLWRWKTWDTVAWRQILGKKKTSFRRGQSSTELPGFIHCFCHFG